MKKYILIASTLIIAFSIKAQTTPPATPAGPPPAAPVAQTPAQGNIGHVFTIGVDGGYAMPEGSFSAAFNQLSYTSTILNGSAKQGYYYDIYAGMKLNRFLGIMLLYGGNSNAYNASGISDFSPPGTASGGYQVYEYLLGPYVSIRLDNWRFEGKLLGGLFSANYPSLDFNSYNDIFTHGFGFGYCVGVGIKYMFLHGHLGVGVGINYVAGTLDYNGWYQTGPGVSETTNSNGPLDMSVKLLQPNIGLNVCF